MARALLPRQGASHRNGVRAHAKYSHLQPAALTAKKGSGPWGNIDLPRGKSKCGKGLAHLFQYTAARP